MSDDRRPRRRRRPRGPARPRGLPRGGWRRRGPAAAEPHLPYRRPPLTKELLRGELEPDELPIAPEPAVRRARRRASASARATALDPGARRVAPVEGASSPTRRASWPRAPSPSRPPVPGATTPGVHLIRAVGRRARPARARAGAPWSSGSGFIGCEATASLARRGGAVTLVTRSPCRRPSGWAPRPASGSRAGWRTTGSTRPGRRDRARSRTTATAAGVDAAGGDPLTADRRPARHRRAPRTELAAAAGLALETTAPSRPTRAMGTSAAGVHAAGDFAAPRTRPPAGRCASSTGATRSPRARSPGGAAGEDAAWDTVPGFWSTSATRTLKYAAWGDGFDDVASPTTRTAPSPPGTATTARRVGVLTHDCDDDYERGRG